MSTNIKVIQQDLAELKCDLKLIFLKMAHFENQLNGSGSVIQASSSILNKHITYLESLLYRKHLHMMGIENLTSQSKLGEFMEDFF